MRWMINLGDVYKWWWVSIFSHTAEMVYIYIVTVKLAAIYRVRNGDYIITEWHVMRDRTWNWKKWWWMYCINQGTWIWWSKNKLGWEERGKAGMKVTGLSIYINYEVGLRMALLYTEWVWNENGVWKLSLDESNIINDLDLWTNEGGIEKWGGGGWNEMRSWSHWRIKVSCWVCWGLKLFWGVVCCELQWGNVDV